MKRVISILITLILLLLIAVYINTQNQKSTTGLIIKYGEIENNIADLSYYESTKITTKNGDDLIAFSLKKIVTEIGLNEKDYSKIVFYSSDGGTLAVNSNEINELYLMEKTKGKKKYLRLIIPNDNFSQRWLKYIVRIEFSND